MKKMMSNGTRLMNEENAANVLKAYYSIVDSPELQDAMEYAIQYLEDEIRKIKEQSADGWD